VHRAHASQRLLEHMPLLLHALVTLSKAASFCEQVPTFHFLLGLAEDANCFILLHLAKLSKSFGIALLLLVEKHFTVLVIHDFDQGPLQEMVISRQSVLNFEHCVRFEHRFGHSCLVLSFYFIGYLLFIRVSRDAVDFEKVEISATASFICCLIKDAFNNLD